MSTCPETPLWLQLKQLATQRGVLGINLRETPAHHPCIIELSWPGGEIETLRFSTGTDLNALAFALARELRLPLAQPSH
jgi:hypothetical protein